MCYIINFTASSLYVTLYVFFILNTVYIMSSEIVLGLLCMIPQHVYHNIFE